MILPLLVMPLVTPAATSTPTAPETLPIWIVPWLLSLWLLSMMTPPPVDAFTVPAELIRISSGAPALTVDVRTGPVTAVAIVVSA